MGTSLRYLPRHEDHPGSGTEGDLPYHAGNVPWQRVVNAKGMVSHRFVTYLSIPCICVCVLCKWLISRGPGSAARQAATLRAEGVRVEEVAGEFYVSLGDYGWFPSFF